MPQELLLPKEAELFLSKLAVRGYLLVSIAEDASAHADALFRQQRTVHPPLMPAAPYWQRNAKFHNWLCDNNQLHLPLRVGAEPAGPAALAWLIPAPTEGEVIANGFKRPWTLDAALREEWLLAWARQVGHQQHLAQRLLLQKPGEMQTAFWYYRSYLGDLPIEGTQVERVCTLLTGLPRYSQNAAESPSYAGPEDAGQNLLLVNESPHTWGAGEVRSSEHCEISPFWGASTYM